jgi:acetyl-CoA carboxylase biotin carboxyl carrier protein
MTQTKKRSGIDLDAVRQLANVLAESGLTEIEYATADCRIRVAKTAAAAPASVAASAAPSAAVLVSTTVDGKDGQARGEAEAFADHPGLLTSPMVGVVYTSPEPAAPPFVRIGDHVAAGDTVLLIEAMKVFNPIKAHRAGSIERLFVSSGMPVEYGEPLLLIA